MTIVSEPAYRSRASSLALRYALRELRGGLRGFYVFIACIALGVMAIAGVGSVAASLSEGLTREGRTLLGGDVAFSLIQREAKPEEIDFLRARGQVSVAAALRVMARSSDGKLALVELKAVDGNYPMLGEVTLDPKMPMADLLAERDGAFGAAVDSTLLARLDLKLGDRITIGNASFQIRSVVVAEPDKLAGNVGLGPRVLVSEASLRATGLLQPGSLVRWIYRVKLPNNAADDRAATQLIDSARSALPEAGWWIRSSSNASPQLERTINRFTPVPDAGRPCRASGRRRRRRQRGQEPYRSPPRRHRLVQGAGRHRPRRLHDLPDAGGPARRGRFGDRTGGRRGVAVHHRRRVRQAAAAAGDPRPASRTNWRCRSSTACSPRSPSDYGRSGGCTTCRSRRCFARRSSREWHRPRWSYLALMAVVIALLVAVAIGLSYDKRVAAVFVVSSVAVFALLRGVAAGLMALARRMPRSRITMLRLAIANIYRPGALTPSVVMSLGLGLAVLVTITQIDGNLRRQFLAALPEHAPSFYFIDIPTADADRFGDFLKKVAPQSTVEDVPMLRGRIVAARGVKADELKPSQDSEWVLQSDRGLTYTSEVPKGSKVVEGEWWSADYSGPPLVSMEKKIADGLKLKIGDEIVVNVLGRDIPAKISNLRNVDWQGLGINFVLVFSPNAFKGAPHTHVATLSEVHPDPAGDARIIKQVADAFPMVTSVRVREALETVGTVVTNLVLAIRGASAVTLISAILVLGGALAAGHRHRVYDAVILKTLGATRARLLGAYALEYLMIGLATAVFGVIAGSVAAWLIVTRLMTLSFIWQAGSAAGVVAAALIVTVGLGLAGTLLALNQKPASVLRNL